MNEITERVIGFAKRFFRAALDFTDFKADVQSIVGMLTVWITAAITATMEVAGPIMTKGIIKAFTVNRGVWASALGTFSEELTGTRIDSAALAASKAGAPLTEFIRGFSSAIGGVVFDTLAPARFPTPEVGRENAQSLFALNTRFGLQGWYAHSIAEMFSLGHFRSLGDLPEAIERSFGLSRVLRLALKPIVKTAIADPLQEYYNRLYQPQFLTVGEVTEAWEKGLATDDQFYDTMAARGYNAARSMVLLNLHQKDFSLAEAQRLWRLRLIDDGKLHAIVRRHGYGDARADLLSTLLRTEKQQTILDELVATARRLFAMGRIGDGELTAILREAHWTDEEIALVRTHESLLRLEQKTLAVGEILEAFERGLILALETRTRLRNLGYADADIDILLGLRVRRLSVSQVTELFSRGALPRSEAERRLEGFGYSPEDAARVLDLHLRQLTEGQVIDALTRGLINIASAREQLRRLGFPPDTVELLLAFTRKLLSVPDIQAALLRNVLTEGEALAKLTQLGFSRADADIIMRLRFRELPRGAILDAYEAGFFTRAEALALLEARGHTREEADILLRMVEQKAIRTGKPIGPAPPPRRPP